tara:strand:- start:1131 stop:1970 length:840 start_codon:yes stop_codon:yes gene_type:complete
MQDSNHLPLVALSLNLNEDNGHFDFTLTPWFAPHTPPLTPASPGANNQMVQRGTLMSQLAGRVLDGGSVSFAVVQVSGRLYQLVVDVSGIPLIESIGVLKSLIADSWIVTSNALAPVAGRDHTKNAFVRALIMLMAKRFIGIKNLGPIREILILLSFIKLASEAMIATNFHPDLSTSLGQIASLPMLLYTAMARIVVDVSANNNIWLMQFPNAAQDASVFRVDAKAKGQLGIHGKKLDANWKEMLNENPNLKRYVLSNALTNRDQANKNLSDFASMLSA